MKKIIYVCLLAVLAISFGCEKDEIVNQADSTIDQEYQKRGTGFGDDGSGGNGQLILDGTNYMPGPPPNGNYWTILITYAQGFTESQKREYRVQYQVTGELYFFEQCPNDSQKELWYFVPASSNVPCQNPAPYSCEGRSDNPPTPPPSGLMGFWQSCDD